MSFNGTRGAKDSRARERPFGEVAAYIRCPMKHWFRLLAVLMVTAPYTLLAQQGPDRIFLMNGQVIEGRVLGQSSFEVRYEIPKGLRTLERSEPTSSVFSVIDSTGVEKVWYFQATLFGNEFSVQEMRWYIEGERDARKGYKPFWSTLGGFVFGAGMVTALDLEMNSLILPPVYAGLMAIPRVHVTPGSLTNPDMEGDPFYATGYSAVARPKRVIRSLISTALGVGVGLAIRQLIINPNNPPDFGP